MKKVWALFKNRYILSSTIALVYILLLHNTDIFSILQRRQNVRQLENEIARKKNEIVDVKAKIASLQDIRSLEKYARENYFFKKDDEDLFIFSFE